MTLQKMARLERSEIRVMPVIQLCESPFSCFKLRHGMSMTRSCYLSIRIRVTE